MNPPIRRPIRIWMTGCAAVVMAALTTSPARSRTLADDESERQRGRSAVLSPYDVTETVCKIEAAAAAHGLKLFARVDQRASAATLVLASSDGVTPVMQGAGAAAIALPLRVEVARLDDGRTEVVFLDPRQHDRDQELKAAEAPGWPMLPDVIEEALRA